MTVEVPAGVDRVSVLGAGERNLKMIREALGVAVASRDGRVHLRGDERAVSVAREVLSRLGNEAGRGESLTGMRVLDLISDEAARQDYSADEAAPELPPLRMRPRPERGWSRRAAAEVSRTPGIGVYSPRRQVEPKTANQGAYLEAIAAHDLVFAVGPAGTGKTYLAVAAAVNMLRSGRARKLILVRPAVEAGERLGFLPGDLQEKVNPYLRPLFDALYDLVDFATIRRFMESDVVEVVPLAFMRGRTLNNAVIILDEAQNTTRGQMKMFLTRMGQGSKTIVTGDVTQIDLPDPRESGLIDAARRLRRVKGAAFVTLDRADVVRHELVQRIVEAYGEEDAHHPAPPLPRLDPTGPEGTVAPGAGSGGSVADQDTPGAH